MITILAAAIALLAILFFGLLSIRSVAGPLNRLRRVMQAVASGEVDTRAEVIGRDSIAAVSAGVNDLLMIIDRLLAEISRQHQALVDLGARLFSLVDGDDSSTLRARLAEVGDPLIVLDSFCHEMIDPAFRRMSDLHGLAQQLNSLSQQIHLQAKENAALASEAPSVAIEEQVQRLTHVAQEMSAIARRLEAIPGEAMNASTKAWGSDASEMPVF
jgi:methyl-accepting chemotaxis protein